MCLGCEKKKVWKFTLKKFGGIIGKVMMTIFSCFCLYTRFKNLEMVIGNVNLAFIWECKGTRKCQKTFEENRHKNQWNGTEGPDADYVHKDN